MDSSHNHISITIPERLPDLPHKLFAVLPSSPSHPLKGHVCLALGTSALLVEKNEKKALAYYQKAEKENVPLAYAIVAFFKEFMLGVEKRPMTDADFEEAEKLYLVAAERGCGMAMARLAFLKTHGRPGIKIDHADAEKWRKGCEGLGEAAVSWLRVTAEAGIPASQFCLALCYYNGIAIAEDDTLAFFWCEKAAQQNHPGAQNVLGNLYVEGSGCVQNPTVGLRWYIKAAEQREAAAIYNIGTLFERGIAVELDTVQAFGWYERAERFGSINAMNVLGIFFEQGIGMERPMQQQAVHYYTKAAAKGHPHAQYNLARCYHEGFGIREDDSLAAQWFQLAAAQNHTLSQLSVAICYEYAIGVEQNFKLSLRNYRLAAVNRCEEARKRLQPSIALKLLAPARILLSNALSNARPANRTNSSKLTIRSLPPELIEHILSMLDPTDILPPAHHRAIYNLAGNRQTLTDGRLRTKERYLKILGLESMSVGAMGKPSVCNCSGTGCEAIRHVVDSIQKAEIALKDVEEEAISPIAMAAEPFVALDVNHELWMGEEWPWGRRNVLMNGDGTGVLPGRKQRG